MNDIQIFNSQEFGQIRISGTSDNPLFCLTDICRVLEIQPSVTKKRLKQDGVNLIKVIDAYGREQLATFVTEQNLYKVIMRSDKPQAEQFQDWICGEILPSIRKHGAYMTPAAIEQALSDPDFIIGLATQLKTEKQRVKQLADENKHKEQIIEGLVANISLADMRQRITQIIRKNGVANARGSYHLLYNEFNAKYHINVYTRMNNIVYKGNAMDYIEKELNMLPQLYDLTCKLFEDSYDSLMKSWGKTIQRATCERNLAKRKLLP
jgi:prophage antirepressor-like protein